MTSNSDNYVGQGLHKTTACIFIAQLFLGLVCSENTCIEINTLRLGGFNKIKAKITHHMNKYFI